MDIISEEAMTNLFQTLISYDHVLSDIYIIQLYAASSDEKSKLNNLRRMASSGMLHSVALVRTDVSEELSASIIRVTRNSERR
jgi:hypothetical protein